jgi:enoyl-CoA hydratase/carnithine racemase
MTTDADILFECRGVAGIVTLNRPTALNAITHEMVRALAATLAEWAKDDGITRVVLQAAGARAFSAGGDIRALYELGRAVRHAEALQFWRDEYMLNTLIKRYPKPYVALIDGIVMGGGVGISFHGSHRVLTENAVFAMPEVGIGFFPDVGGSHLLSDLGGWFGMYLGLTGTRIRYGDALWSGLATHTTKAEFQAGLIERIAETGDADLALRECFGPARRETDDATLHKIARHFAGPSLHDIVESLEIAAPNDDFARDTLATMKKRSPTSLNVAFRQITAGSTLSIEECMRMEFRILNRMLAGHDFYEGIRAAIIDKGDTPRWVPATLAEVKAAEIDRYFAPLGDRELTLP